MDTYRSGFKSTFISLTVLSVLAGTGYIYSFVEPAAPASINEVVATGTVTLEASPPPAKKYIGESFVLDINAKSGTDKVTAVQLELTYDRAKLELSNFTKTDYLPNILAAPAINNGKVTAVLAAPPESGGRPDWGTVGKITVKPLALGNLSIYFGPNTLISAISRTTNALKTANPIDMLVYNLGDINQDKKVDLFDYNDFVSNFSIASSFVSDVDHNHKVDLFDYNTLVVNFGKTSP